MEVVEKSYKTPSYIRKAQRDYLDRNKDNEDFKAKKRAIANSWYSRNKERLREQRAEKKAIQELIETTTEEELEKLWENVE